MLKLLAILILSHTVLTQRYNCSEKSALQLLKRPAYEFSIKILDRVTQNNDAHFVFSPLSAWLQLSALAEGAKGRTFRELWSVTKQTRNKCYKSKLSRIIRKQSKYLSAEYRRRSVIVIDKFMGAKKRFIKDVQQLYGVKVLLKNFDQLQKSAEEVNNFVAKGTDGIISNAVYIDDFNKTYMLLSDNVVFKSAWKFPFDTARTQVEPFKSFGGALLGNVNMMGYTGYLNIAEMSIINARVLEIPCLYNFSMLVLLPLKRSSIYDTFYYLNRTTLMSVFNAFKMEGEKLVNVKLPRFRINSTVDNLAELLYDMNVKRIFDPNAAELSHISDFTLYASLVTQEAHIEVTEQGVRANASPASLINETSEKIDFFVNRPFAYLIVEKKTQFILFAGTYSEPELY